MARPYTFNPSAIVYVKDWVDPPFTQVRTAAAMQMTPWLSFDQEVKLAGIAGYIQRFLLDPALTPLVGYFEDPEEYHRLSYLPTGAPDFAILEAIPIMEGATRHCWLVHAIRETLLSAVVPDAIIGGPAPVGAIILWGASVIPLGWSLCNGAEIDRTAFNELFLIWGTRFGSGNGTTTFNVPNTRGFFIRGAGDLSFPASAIGATGGNRTTTLIIANLPPHGHQVPYSLNLGSSGTVRLGDAGTGGQFTTGLSNGTSTPFSNEPQFLSLEYIYKAYRHPDGTF